MSISRVQRIGKLSTFLHTQVRVWGLTPVPPACSVAELARIESERHAIAKARDVLESTIYRLRDKFQYYGVPEDEGGDETLPKVLTLDQKKPLEEKVKEFYEWLEDHGFDASLDELQTRQKALNDAWNEISRRIHELIERPKIIDHLTKAITKARVVMADTKSQVNKYASSETAKVLVNFEEFERTVKEADEWLAEATAKLEGHVDHVDAPVKVKEFEHWLAKATRATDNYNGRLSIAERVYLMEEEKRKLKERQEKEAAEKAEKERKGEKDEGKADEGKDADAEKAPEEGGADKAEEAGKPDEPTTEDLPPPMIDDEPRHTDL